MKGQRVLITGGAGFIGSHLAERLVSEGARVTVADNLTRGRLSNLKNIQNNITFLNLDLRDAANCDKATKGQTIVYNLAAKNTGVDFDVGNTQLMFEENMLLQMMPLRSAAANGVKKFIQISSASVYSQKTMEQKTPIKETEDGGLPEPSKLGYALAKRMGEQLTRWYVQNSSLDAVIARFINVYGDRDSYDRLSHFIPSIVRKFLVSSTSIEVFGSGNQKRSFMHVDDAAEALLILTQKGKRGEAYNIDPQDEHSVKEIVRAIQKLMHKQHVSILYNPKLPEGSKRRLLDSTKIRRLGWKPKHNLIDSLEEVIRDISSHISHE